MSYSSKFIESGEAARDLLLAAGYASAAALDAITKLSELCVYAELVQKMTQDHVKGDSLPPHFETEINLKPIKLRGTTTVNILEDLENKNVLVPRSGKYRVMLSNMMNRIFSLTAISGTESIREAISKLHDVDTFSKSLETIEWEIVSSLHDNIDAKYLDIPTLEANKIPVELIEQVNVINEVVEKLGERAIDLDETSEYLIDNMCKGKEGKENLELLHSYVIAIKRISELIEIEAKERWALIQGATKYPQSLLRSEGPPLIKSSWHLNPEFRNHPLIEKFKDIMSTNLEFIAGVLTVYDSQITNVIETVGNFPTDPSLFDNLCIKDPTFPTGESVSAWLTKIGKQAPGLKAQVKLLTNVINNNESLFQHT